MPTAVSAPPTPLLIDCRQAAALLGFSPRKLWALTQDGSIPSRRVGRLVRYSPDELRKWIAAGCPTTPAADRD